MALAPFHGAIDGLAPNLEPIVRLFPTWSVREADGLWCVAFALYCCREAGFDIPYRPGECRSCHLAACLGWEEFAAGDRRIEYHKGSEEIDMRIVFVRHGEPDYASDSLTALGREQARAAAVRLKEEGVEEIWSSPLGRALETAKAASDALRLPVQTLDFMREVRWGSMDGNEILCSGHPWAIVFEMAGLGLDLNAPNWRDLPYFRNNRLLECIDRIENGIDEWLERYGYVREGRYYRHTTEEKRQRTIALFSHGGSSCAAMGHILNLQFPCACALLHIDYTGITVVQMESRSGSGTLSRLTLSNDARHIRGVQDSRQAHV